MVLIVLQHVKNVDFLIVGIKKTYQLPYGVH